MRKIYDCFPFFNELDLLELRLTECYDHVDHFVIAEANISHSGNPKEYIFENNKERFASWLDKIIHIKVGDVPRTQNPWVRENFQRDALIRGLNDVNDNDVVIVSDCDEILRPRTLDIIRNDLQHNIWRCYHPLFYFKVNHLKTRPGPYWAHPVAVVKRGGFPGCQYLRNMHGTPLWQLPYDYDDGNFCSIQHAGWHFTYFGDSKQSASKLLNFAHTEDQNLASSIDVNFNVAHKRGIHVQPNGEEFEHIKLDEYFPKTILNNLDRWRDYIIPDATANIRDYLPALGIEEIYK
jgi:hypothetical protein